MPDLLPCLNFERPLWNVPLTCESSSRVVGPVSLRRFLPAWRRCCHSSPPFRLLRHTWT